MIGEAHLHTRVKLGDALFALSSLAHDLRAGSDTIHTLSELGTALRDPYVVVVVGEVKAGKSSLLNALFGRELCKVDVLPATDRIYLFKYGEEEKTAVVSPQMSECYRGDKFLQHFHIVDTPGTNTIVAEHESITRQFLPLADLCLCVFSATNPWGATAWHFLQHVHRRWLKKVVFVLQQTDLRSPEEIAAILAHMEQTMQQKLGEACPIFAVSARNAQAAKQLPAGNERNQALEASGFTALERFIEQQVIRSDSRGNKLRSACKSGQVILDDLGGKLRHATTTLTRDLRQIEEMKASLHAREEQSLRQMGGMLWTLAQSFERTQKHAEELLAQKLTVWGTLRLVTGRRGWQQSFQTELETRQRESLTRHIAVALQSIQADLHSVWQELHEQLQRNFAGQSAAPSLPDLDRQRRELLERIECTMAAKAQAPEFEQQMQRLFADTAAWLRVPAGLFAAGGIASAMAASLAKLTVLDLTGSIAAVGAVTGTAVAVVRRKKIRAAYRKQTLEKRDATLHAIEDHLRHALNQFYQELERTFLPLQTFCTGQKRSLEPYAAKMRELEQTFLQCAVELQ